MKKEEDKKRKGPFEKVSIKKVRTEDFKQKVRAAYSTMDKMGDQARVK